jgi:hypothetical protein
MMAGGISEISRELESGWKLASVREDLAVDVVDFVQNHRLFARLNDFHGFGKQPCHWPAILAVANICALVLRGALFHCRFSFRPQRGLAGFDVKQDVVAVFVYRLEFHPDQRSLRFGLVRGAENAFEFSDLGALVHPYACQIRFAIVTARRRRGQVRFSVFQPWYGRIRVVQPLRVRPGTQDKRQEEETPANHFHMFQKLDSIPR